MIRGTGRDTPTGRIVRIGCRNIHPQHRPFVSCSAFKSTEVSCITSYREEQEVFSCT